MKIGFISDAHGNPFGLKLCLDLLRSKKAEQTYFLGDALGYLPNVAEVLNLLKTNGVCCLKGNHEAMLLEQLPLSPTLEVICRIEEARKRMSLSEIREISSWKVKKMMKIDGKRILLMHGRPDAPLNGYLYPDSNWASFEGIDADVLLVGHTHRPFSRHDKTLKVVNVGSTGLPRQGGGKATCAIYDTIADYVQLLQVQLPIQKLLRHYQGAVHDLVLDTLRR